MASLHKRRLKTGIAYEIRWRSKINNPHGPAKYRQHAHKIPKGTTYQQAKAILLEFNQKILKEKFQRRPFLNPFRSSTLTLAEFRDWFLENKVRSARKGKALDPRTKKHYDYSFRILMGILSPETRLADAEQFLAHIERGIVGRAPAGQSMLVRAWRAAWNFAAGRGLIEGPNPFLKIVVSKEKKIPPILSAEEKEKIQNYIADPASRIGFAVCRYTGLRGCEIVRNAAWEKVDWTSRLLFFDGKTGAGQAVHIPPRLYEMMRNVPSKTGHIVPHNYRTFYKHITNAMQEAGVTKPGAIRILRHSFATGLMGRNANFRLVQGAMRHSSMDMTTNYAQIADPDLADLIDSRENSL